MKHKVDEAHEESSQSALTAAWSNPLIKVVVAMLLIWTLYRILFINIPLFLEETFVKLIFFGLPVWLYVFITGEPNIFADLKMKKLLPGVFGGIIIGGLFFLIGSLATSLGVSQFLIGEVFFTPRFWREIFLGVMTGFWESLFFFGWIAASFHLSFPHWSIWRCLSLVTGVFILFHLPALLIQASGVSPAPLMSVVGGHIVLLGVFSLAQGLIYYQTRNIYLLSLTHAFWGLTIQFYG